ncbi:MAG: 4-hydroxybenzoyl-CoA thioesterase [Gammaproteobacteria bacterium SG8_15]|nr:MAG: 4-hydroxybenzoyl-CoA thioesterase [Gammaproteobacteria bacterium SG8_15]
MREFIWQARVYYEDTDSGGVVYYANYLKFLERARTEWLRSFGIQQDTLVQQDGLIFAVRSVQLEYVKPAKFNDLLDISVAISQAGKASLTFDQTVRQAEGEKQLLCSGKVKIACLTADTLRPKAIPEKISREIFGGS